MKEKMAMTAPPKTLTNRTFLLEIQLKWEIIDKV
jgi:hypothetical protein